MPSDATPPDAAPIPMAAVTTPIVPMEGGGMFRIGGPPGGTPSGTAYNPGAASESPDAVQVPIGVLCPNRPAIRFPLLLNTKFPRRAWDPARFAQTVLAEFGASGWMGKLRLGAPPDDPAEIASEITALLALAEWRSDCGAEIITQAEDLLLYWSDQLMATATSRPATWDLIVSADMVAQLVANHFKRIFSRPRPVQVYPALMPMILTPGHPSYPNSHALESMTISLCMSLAVPALEEPLVVLARRVAQNREIAGVHYPSDTAASFGLAPAIVKLLAQGPLFREILAQVELEWAEVTAMRFPGT